MAKSTTLSHGRKIDGIQAGDIALYGYAGGGVWYPVAVDSDGVIKVGTTSNYVISDKDDDASPNYYGFVNADGGWYILKETVSAGADTYRYIKGDSDYTTNWTGRAGLTYGYFNAIF